MFNLLRQRNFGLLWFGQLISIIGDWVLFVALPFYVYDMTGSALATGTMFAAQLLPSLLLGSVAGVFVDRWNRKRIMIASDVLRALVLLLLLVVRSPDQLWAVYLVAFAQSCIGQFFAPAKNAVIPQLVSEPDLLGANSLNAISDSLTRLIGPSLGGVLMASLGLTSVVLVDSASFFISALMILLIAVPRVEPTAAETRPVQPVRAQWTKFWREWLEGLRVIRHERTLSAIFAVTAISALADAIISGLFVVFVKQFLNGTSQELGWLMAAQGLGGLIGGVLLTRMSKQLGMVRMIVLGLMTIGIMDPLIFLSRSVPIALVLILPVGITVVGAMVNMNTLLQASSSDEFRGRVFGALFTTNSLMRLVGIIFASALADVVGSLPMLFSSALLWLLSGVVAWAMLPAAKDEAPAPAVAERTRVKPTV